MKYLETKYVEPKSSDLVLNVCKQFEKLAENNPNISDNTVLVINPVQESEIVCAPPQYVNEDNNLVELVITRQKYKENLIKKTHFIFPNKNEYKYYY